jgi:AAA+ superfamily predicted ATPase
MSTSDLIATHILAILIGVVGGVWAAVVVVRRRRSPIPVLLRRHFQTTTLAELAITGRQFPARVRADLQRALDRLFGAETRIARVCGIRQEHVFFGLSFAELLATDSTVVPVAVAYEELDIGEDAPVRCMANALWLLENGPHKYAVLMSPLRMPGEMPLQQFQVATRNDEDGARFTQTLFATLESAVQKAQSYRGKILSLNAATSYSGESTGITVHKLRSVAREEVVLPPNTLHLLERNVIRFVRQRQKLNEFGQSTKKGLLFYGPPGNGKTHTIHYLIGTLQGHTTLLIAAEQMGQLGEYMTLARLLQPSVVVIEDVDLIAKERTMMDSSCQESLLNKLLNEMDGLTESADILFILTTNRPAELEQALASRPGRIDQAIEFSLPDKSGREKLARLYSRGIDIPDGVLDVAVQRTEKASAAFIKELMRRSIEFHLERSDSRTIELPDVENALEELLFSGGALNPKLLGADSSGMVAIRGFCTECPS